jgi:hypothetical protein
LSGPYFTEVVFYLLQIPIAVLPIRRDPREIKETSDLLQQKAANVANGALAGELLRRRHNKDMTRFFGKRQLGASTAKATLVAQAAGISLRAV